MPLCDKPGCGREMVLQWIGSKAGDFWLCPRGDDAHALCARVAELEAKLAEAQSRIQDLEAAIGDIDAHATPCGLLDPDDPEGSPLYYTISTGSLHRALGIKAGGAYREGQRPTFTREMILECLRKAAPGADELRKTLERANRIPGRLY